MNYLPTANLIPFIVEQNIYLMNTFRSLNFFQGDQVADIEFYKKKNGFENAQNSEICLYCVECKQRLR